MKKRANWIQRTVYVIGFILVLFPSQVVAQGGDPPSKADALMSEGDTFYEQRDYEAAIQKYQDALNLYQEDLDQTGVGRALTKIGIAYFALGQYDEALEYFQRALPIRIELEDRTEEANTLSNIAQTYERMGQLSKALDYYEQALEIRQEIGDPASEARSLNSIGLIHLNGGQYAAALDYFQQALTIRQELGDKLGQASVLNNIGGVYQRMGLFQEALDYLQQALAAYQETGDPRNEARTLINIGVVYDSLAQYSQALDHYERGVALLQESGDRAGEGTGLSNIGDTYRKLGQYSQALEFSERALAIQREIRDRVGEGATLTHIGAIYDGLGQYRQALQSYQQALTILRERSIREGEEASLNNIGTVYTRLGQYEQALDYFQQALIISQEIGDRVGETAALSNIGDANRSLGKHEQAVDAFQQALLISQEIGDLAGESSVLNNIGTLHEAVGQYARALDYYQQALSITEATNDQATQATLLDNIGRAYLLQGQYSQALDHFERSLVLRQEIGDQNGQWKTLGNLGWLYEEQGNDSQAITYYQQATTINASIRGDLKVEELKSAFAVEHSATYERLINLLWNQGRFEEAFTYVEQARARAFLDQLAGGHVDFHSGADAGLLEREQQLRLEIKALREQLITLRNRPQTEWDTQAIGAAQADLSARETSYSELLTEIKLQSPEVAALVSVDVASLADIQAKLNPSITLVEYYVTTDRTFIFIIGSNIFDSVAVEVSADEISQTIDDFRDFASLEEAHPDDLVQLHTWLIDPIEDKLKTPVLGIIPHGVLHYLPFAALTDSTQYFGSEYSLFTLPSATVLGFIQEKQNRPINTVLALGNPITSEPGLAPLAFAEQEVRTISGLFSSQPLIGKSASENALRSQAANASIVHLAAHGQYNPFNPLFSVIYLSDDQLQDGRLEVNEIYALDLMNATSLVVLSACETQIGSLSAGDEVVGMTRAFLYAGTPSVMASLWKVDDQATTLLMERFYTYLRSGLGKAQALRQAQEEVRAQYPHPYYWAAFVLTGDPGSINQERQIPVSSSGQRWQQLGSLGVLFLGIGCVGILGLFAGLFIWRRRRKGVTK